MVIEQKYYNDKVNWLKVLTSNGLTGTINLNDVFCHTNTFITV